MLFTPFFIQNLAAFTKVACFIDWIDSKVLELTPATIAPKSEPITTTTETKEISKEESNENSGTVRNE